MEQLQIWPDGLYRPWVDSISEWREAMLTPTMRAFGYRQIGQLFMVGFDGTNVTPQIRSLIQDYHVGCVMLAAKNFKSAEQATRLILELQTIARHAGHVAPLLIALDQENGGVSSLYDADYIQQFPSQMGIAAAGSKTLAREVAQATAQELSAVGVNMILGPVLDVLKNLHTQPLGVRSVGNDPQEVSSYGGEFMQGYHDAGITACGKHFPSYGNLEYLEHQGDVPVISQSLDQLSRSALLPFRTAVSHGIDAMLVGGCVISENGTTGTHACLAEPVVEGLLRRDLKFDGVVLSDCLEMESLIHAIGVGSGTVMSVKAGCDLAVLCRTFSIQQEAIHSLKVGVDSGIVSRERIQQSYGRILNLKSRCTSWEKALNPPGISLLSLMQPSHAQLSERAYNSSITVVRDNNSFLPLSKVLNEDEPLLLLTPHIKPLAASASNASANEHNGLAVMSTDQVSWQRSTTETSGEGVFRELGRSLTRARNGRVLHASYTSTGVSAMHEKLIERSGAVVVVTANANHHRYQASFTKFVSLICNNQQLLNGEQKTKPFIVVSVSSPFDFSDDDKYIGTYICTYDFTETALNALVRILYGGIAPTGRLPGATGEGQVAPKTRQHWLVENWNEQRDAMALNQLLEAVRRDPASSMSTELAHVTHNTFLLHNPFIDELHYVVRNSSTRTLYGFCSTYISKSTSNGAIGAIIVDPGRRRMSIAHSLHSRAMRGLLQRSDVRRLQLGSRLPGIYLGIPLGNPSEARRLRSWFSGLGWNTAQSCTRCTMVLRDLATWTAPREPEALLSGDVEYDFLFEPSQCKSLLDALRKNTCQGVYESYRMALDTSAFNTGVIRASHNGIAIGTTVVCPAQSALGQYSAALKEAHNEAGGIMSPIVSQVFPESDKVARNLVVHGAKMIRQLGGNAVVLDSVDPESPFFDSLVALGFTILHSFEEVESNASAWISPAP